MYKNIIIDFGQVIVHFDPLYMTSRYINDKADIDLVSEVVFDRLYWDRLDDGTITDDEVKTEICKRLPERLHLNAVKTYDNWYHNLPVIDGIAELIEDIKSKGLKLYLLSNISIGFAENYHNNQQIKEILDLFDGLVFSGELGIVKPEREIFKHITEKYNLKKEDSVFIDDNPLNINGAESFGIKGYLFDGDINKLREFLSIRS